MKQTAVDWFSNQSYELFEQYSEGKFDRRTLNSMMLSSTDKAKEMEKEQIRTIVLAYQEERNGRSDGAQNQWEPYEVDEFLENYNETFNTNN
jgi:hypothetical protein